MSEWDLDDCEVTVESEDTPSENDLSSFEDLFKEKPFDISNNYSDEKAKDFIAGLDSENLDKENSMHAFEAVFNNHGDSYASVSLDEIEDFFKSNKSNDIFDAHLTGLDQYYLSLLRNSIRSTFNVESLRRIYKHFTKVFILLRRRDSISNRVKVEYINRWSVFRDLISDQISTLEKNKSESIIERAFVKDILLLVRQAGGKIKQKQIKDKLALTKNYLSNIIALMLEHNLIAKIPQGRENTIQITSFGESLLSSAKSFDPNPAPIETSRGAEHYTNELTGQSKEQLQEKEQLRKDKETLESKVKDLQLRLSEVGRMTDAKDDILPVFVLPVSDAPAKHDCSVNLHWDMNQTYWPSQPESVVKGEISFSKIDSRDAIEGVVCKTNQDQMGYLLFAPSSNKATLAALLEDREEQVRQAVQCIVEKDSSAVSQIEFNGYIMTTPSSASGD